jgi:MFS family permease
MLFILNQFGGGTAGIRAAFWLPGLAGGTALLLLITLFRNEPADLGMRPLGASSDEPIRKLQKGAVAQTRSKVFLHQVQRTTTFWNLIGIHFWGCAGHAIIIVYLVAMAEAKGVTGGVAAGTFIILSVSSSTTRFVVPVVADRVGSKWAMGVCFFLQTAPVLILFFADAAWMFYVFAALFGIGFGGEMSAFPIINRQYYGSAPIGTTFGWQMMGSGIGMAAGALAGGQLRDLTGDFNATIALSFTMSLIGELSILLLPSTTRHLLPNWEDALPEEVRSAAPP